MSAPGFDVKYVAHLARLALTPEEEQKFQAQLDHVLGYIAKLNELDVSHVEPTAHAVPLVNVRWETLLERPVAEVRARLGVTALGALWT
jgi:aspartyl-tRNA(Asn)/glutamyl-tRNA(Gln) amidotransferase subunit C